MNTDGEARGSVTNVLNEYSGFDTVSQRSMMIPQAPVDSPGGKHDDSAWIRSDRGGKGKARAISDALARFKSPDAEVVAVDTVTGPYDV